MQQHICQALNCSESQLVCGKRLAAEWHSAVTFGLFDEHFNSGPFAIVFFVDSVGCSALHVCDDAANVEAFICVIDSNDYIPVPIPFYPVVFDSVEDPDVPF